MSAEPTLIILECDSFITTQREGRIVLEVRGATATPELPPHRNYLTTVQIAKRLGGKTSTRTVRKLMRHPTNPIPHIYVGKRPRFVECEVAEWAERGTSLAAKRAKDKFLSSPAVAEFGGIGRK